MPVYFIRAPEMNAVKIGRAMNVVRRAQFLQTSIPVRLYIVRLLDGGFVEENTLHERFAAYCLVGEWFTYVPEMLAEDFGMPDLPIPMFAHRALQRIIKGAYDAPLAKAIERAGGPSAVAKHLGIVPSAVTQWTRLPARHIPRIEALTGIPGRELRPDLYPEPVTAAEIAA